MKKSVKNFFFVVSGVLPALLVAGCAYLPTPAPVPQPRQYKPLGSDLAEMAAPQPTTPPLYCLLGRGTARFAHGFQPYTPVTFQLYAGARVNVTITSAKGEAMQVQGIFDPPGQKLIFCPVFSGPATAEIACNSFYALEDDLRMGIRRTFDIPDAVTGSTISCGYDPGNLPPLPN